MKRKILIVIALLMIFVTAFAACNTNQYPFDALTNPGSGEAVNWGGSFVEKGEWFYFVNGIQAPDEEDANKWGEERLGMLVRVKISEIGKEDADIQTVVPKIIYTQNVKTFGFRIIGERIYYATPNSERDASGRIQNTKTDIMSVKVDGTDTKRLHTFDNDTTDFMISVVGDKVYITYYNSDGELHTIDVNASKDKDKVISEHVESGYIFDRDRQEVFYTVSPIKEKEKEDDPDDFFKYNILYKYVAGSDPIELKNGKANSENDIVSYEKMTIVYAREGIVWFTLIKGRISGTESTLWRASSAADAVKVSATPYTVFYPFKEDGKDALIVYDDKTTAIWKLVFKSDGSGALADGVKSQVKLCADGGEDISFLRMSKNGDFVYYSSGGTIRRLDLSLIQNDGYGLQESATITDGSPSTGKASFVLVERPDGEVWVIYNTSGIKDYDYTNQYFYKTTYDEGDKKLNTVIISKLFEDED